MKPFVAIKNRGVVIALVTHFTAWLIVLSIIVLGNRQISKGLILADLAHTELSKTILKKQALLESIPDLVLNIDGQGNFLDLKTGQKNLFPFSGEMKGKNLTGFFPEEVAQKWFLLISKVLESNQMHTLEYQLSGLGKDLHYEARFVQYGPEEVIVLLRDVTERKMAEKELMNYQVKLEEKVTEKTTRLEAANVELQTLDKLKDNLIATVSHELRTPITSIIGFAEILDECEVDSENHKKFLHNIINEAARLELIIENILDTSSVQSGSIKYQFQKTEINQTINRAIQSVSGILIDKPDMTIEFKPAAPNITFQADEERLVQVFVNLLGNSLKFSSDKGKIEIEVKEGKNVFTVSVRDEGPGIPEKELIIIFERFRQVTRKNSDIKGSGLGLTISKGIIEAHKGKIWAENWEHGAIFYCTLPYSIH